MGYKWRMADNANDLRRRMTEMARDKRRRINPPASRLPCKWQPYCVESPRTGMPFTDREAWSFIGDLLETGKPWEEIVMDEPPGITGYVFKERLYSWREELYIKIHPMGNVIQGRSFHWSDFHKKAHERED